MLYSNPCHECTGGNSKSKAYAYLTCFQQVTFSSVKNFAPSFRLWVASILDRKCKGLWSASSTLYSPARRAVTVDPAFSRPLSILLILLHLLSLRICSGHPSGPNLF
jgi:hypothetical protein